MEYTPRMPASAPGSQLKGLDLAKWLEKKLGDSTEQWNGRNAASFISKEMLEELETCFQALEPQVKLKLVTAILHVQPRLMGAWKSQLSTLLGLARRDPDDWVETISEMYRELPTTGRIIPKPSNPESYFYTALNDLRTILSKHNEAGDLKLLPPGTNIVSHSVMKQQYGLGEIEVEKHFNLRRKPKSHVLKMEVLKAAEAAANPANKSRAGAVGALPICKVRSTARLPNNDLPMKGMAGNTCKLSAGFTNEPKKFQRSLSKREGGAKLLDISDLPQSLKRRKTDAAQEEKKRKLEEKEAERKKMMEEKEARLQAMRKQRDEERQAAEQKRQERIEASRAPKGGKASRATTSQSSIDEPGPSTSGASSRMEMRQQFVGPKVIAEPIEQFVPKTYHMDVQQNVSATPSQPTATQNQQAPHQPTVTPQAPSTPTTHATSNTPTIPSMPTSDVQLFQMLHSQPTRPTAPQAALQQSRISHASQPSPLMSPTSSEHSSLMSPPAKLTSTQSGGGPASNASANSSHNESVTSPLARMPPHMQQLHQQVQQSFAIHEAQLKLQQQQEQQRQAQQHQQQQQQQQQQLRAQQAQQLTAQQQQMLHLKQLYQTSSATQPQHQQEPQATQATQPLNYQTQPLHHQQQQIVMPQQQQQQQSVSSAQRPAVARLSHLPVAPAQAVQQRRASQLQTAQLQQPSAVVFMQSPLQSPNQLQPPQRQIPVQQNMFQTIQMQPQQQGQLSAQQRLQQQMELQQRQQQQEQHRQQQQEQHRQQQQEQHRQQQQKLQQQLLQQQQQQQQLEQQRMQQQLQQQQQQEQQRMRQQLHQQQLEQQRMQQNLEQQRLHQQQQQQQRQRQQQQQSHAQQFMHQQQIEQQQSNRNAQQQQQMNQQVNYHAAPTQAEAAPKTTTTPAEEGKVRRQCEEMLRAANRLDPIGKKIVLDFMTGNKTNPRPELGHIITLRLSETIEDGMMESGLVKMRVETFFQMDFASGEWKRLRKCKLLTEDEMRQHGFVAAQMPMTRQPTAQAQQPEQQPRPSQQQPQAQQLPQQQNPQNQPPNAGNSHNMFLNYSNHGHHQGGF